MCLLAMVVAVLLAGAHAPVGASPMRSVIRPADWSQLPSSRGSLGEVRVWMGDRLLIWGRPSAYSPGLSAIERQRVRADVLVFDRAARWVCLTWASRGAVAGRKRVDGFACLDLGWAPRLRGSPCERSGLRSPR